MNLDANQIEGEPQEVGTADGCKILHVKTKGGLHTLWKTGRHEAQMIGSGPYRAVAMAVADRIVGRVAWSVLEKSEPPNESEVAEWVEISKLAAK